MNDVLDDDACWNAVATRDPGAVGRFWYGVRTTGVYCRPDCAARPTRANVTFHASTAAARAAGYRACRRCEPERERIRYATTRLGVGTLLLACAAQTVIAIELADDAPGLRAALDSVVAAIATGDVPRLALAPRGSAFQQRVWRELQRIPRGTTIGYGELARRIGAPRAVRAVASACGANPLAVLLPCHRVLRGDGSLGGYRWGLARKRALLAMEGVVPAACGAGVRGAARVALETVAA